MREERTTHATLEPRGNSIGDRYRSERLRQSLIRVLSGSSRGETLPGSYLVLVYE